MKTYSRNASKTRNYSGNYGNPDILILDEPMNGFYNDGVNDIRKLFLIAEFKKLP